MTYGTECWAVRKKDENRLHVAEMRMLRWIRGKTRKDHVGTQVIQEDAKVCQIPETENTKLVWTHQEERRRQHIKTNDGLYSGGSWGLGGPQFCGALCKGVTQRFPAGDLWSCYNPPPQRGPGRAPEAKHFGNNY